MKLTTLILASFLLSGCFLPINETYSPNAHPGMPQPSFASQPMPVSGRIESSADLTASRPPGIPFAAETVVDDETNADLSGMQNAYSDGVELDGSTGAGSDGSFFAEPDEPVEDWLAEENKTLREVLSNWADRAGWRLIWQTDREYRLGAGAMFRGQFRDVTSALVRAFGRAVPPPYATFYNGNRVLVVKTEDSDNAE